MTPGKDCAATTLAGSRGAGTSVTLWDAQHSTATTAVNEPPEHRGERRRFLMWALMLGATPPERVVGRIVDELRDEGQA